MGRSSITNFEAGVLPRISYTSESLIESLFGELLRMELISKLVESIHGASSLHIGQLFSALQYGVGRQRY